MALGFGTYSSTLNAILKVIPENIIKKYQRQLREVLPILFGRPVVFGLSSTFFLDRFMDSGFS